MKNSQMKNNPPISLSKLSTRDTIEKLNLKYLLVTSNTINLFVSNKKLSNYLVVHVTCCRCLNLSTSMGGTRSKVEGGDRHDLESEGAREDTRHKIYTGSGSQISYPTSCLE
jgi:hypothetical protein